MKGAVMARNTFDRILALLHEATLDDARWPAASALIDEACRARGNSLVFTEGRSQKDVRIFFACFYYRGRRNRRLEREYFDVYHPVDERVPRLRQLPDSRLVHATDLFTDDERKTSRVYNVVMPSGHCRDSLNVRLDGPNGSSIVWIINDPVDADGWSPAQTELIRNLLPHIRQYVSVRQALAGAGALGASLAEMLDNTGSSIIQLDGRGRIVAANDGALDLLRTGDGLIDKGGFLGARSSPDDADLQRLLTRALPPFGGPAAGGSMTVRRPLGRPPLVLHVNPVGRRETDVPVWPVAALALVVDPTRRTRVDATLTAAGLGLTGMECRVAVLLAEGSSVREIAAATGRRESTIRWHLQHIFSKHGISRQAELVRLVLSLAGAPDSRRASH